MEPLVLTIAQAAEALQCSTRHVRRLIKAGRLPSVALGDRLVIPRRALEAWLEEAASAGLEPGPIAAAG